MLVRKFEGDTVDEALKAVKRELGPDAIILKTQSGRKSPLGNFLSKKVEITAAVSEDDLKEKQKLDKVLSAEERTELYGKSSQKIKEITSSTRPRANSGYGNLGLNRAAAAPKAENDLDSFLRPETSSEPITEYREIPQEVEISQASPNTAAVNDELLNRIDNLEMRLAEFQLGQKKLTKGPFFQALEGLRILGVSEKVLQNLSKKYQFEKGPEDEDSGAIYDFILRELNSIISCKPLALASSSSEKPQVLSVLSEGACGQSSLLLKMAATYGNCEIIHYTSRKEEIKSVNSAEHFLGIKKHQAASGKELFSKIHQIHQNGKHALIEVELTHGEAPEQFKTILGIERAYKNSEIALCLSAIQSYAFNHHLIAKYKRAAQKVLLTHLDLCNDYSALMNLSFEHKEISYALFGSGPTLPSGLEEASAQKVIEGVFA